MDSDWLIIGGGIHGVHIAARLIGEGNVAPERVRILDPADQLLARWRACTTTTGMTHLRSPSVHNLDLDSFSLQRFAGRPKHRKRGLFAPPYNRPSLALFDAHCDQVIETFKINTLHIQARAAKCHVDCDGVTVETSTKNHLQARNVVLALGTSEQPYWPAWAPQHNPRIHHVFQPGFDGWPSDQPETIAVVGGGISAGQIALRLREEGHRVHLICRHPPRQHQFDSDPGWLGPKFMGKFDRERNFERRRAMIGEARHRGSLPPDVLRALRRAKDQAQMTWHETAVENIAVEHDELRLHLSTNETVHAERLLLATGFTVKRPGGALVDDLIASASLPCAECGYPIVDSALRWHPRIHVTGPLAELELGPTSRNIAGARNAAERLLSTLHKEDSTPLSMTG